MDQDFEEILANLPAKRARSRLEPYAALINELRDRGWGYRDIVRVLAEKCDVQTSVSNLHHFVRQHSSRQTLEARWSIQPKTPATPDSEEQFFEFDAEKPLKLT